MMMLVKWRLPRADGETGGGGGRGTGGAPCAKGGPCAVLRWWLKGGGMHDEGDGDDASDDIEAFLVPGPGRRQGGVGGTGGPVRSVLL